MVKKSKSWRFVLIGFIILVLLLIGLIQFFPSLFYGEVEEANVLVFYHGWTSPGEQSALNALIDVFIEEYPDTVVMPTPLISGSSVGGGNVLFEIVSSILLSGDAPDAFAMHAGYEAKTYVDAGLLEPVDEIWESQNLESVTPKVVQLMCQLDGDYYSVPIDIHRTNVVWYNKKLIDKANINVLSLTDWDSFFAACDKLRNYGVQYPIQIAEAWTAQHAFDQIVASQGIEFYEDWINGKVTSTDDSRLLNALEIFKKYLSYANPDHADLAWDVSIERLIDGEGAFNIMGDWANGEFIAQNKIYNSDYGSFVVPGTKSMYGLVIDTFQLPKNVKHPSNSEKWLNLVGSQEGQDAFNPLKGSISARVDTDVSKYGVYQQTSIFDFITLKTMFPAVSNGAPKVFEINEQNVISQFAKDLDVEKAAKDIAEFNQKISDKYTINWELD